MSVRPATCPHCGGTGMLRGEFASGLAFSRGCPCRDAERPTAEDVRGILAAPPQCGKGTANGPAAESSPFGFAPCTLPPEHGGRCRAEEPTE